MLVVVFLCHSNRGKREKREEDPEITWHTRSQDRESLKKTGNEKFPSSVGFEVSFYKKRIQREEEGVFLVNAEKIEVISKLTTTDHHEEDVKKILNWLKLIFILK